MQRELDLVLIGATGFVGRLTAAHLARSAPPGARIALAGRSPERLQGVRDELTASARDWPLIHIDVTDQAECEALARRATVVVTTAGPYAVLGLPLARACAEAGTHYADLTGEVLFVHQTVTELHETARASGARIVHSCGFDSVPSDLGVWLTAERARNDDAGGLAETVLTVRRLRGGLSGGTIDSMRQQVIEARKDSAARRVLTDPTSLQGSPAGEETSRRGAAEVRDRHTRRGVRSPVRREPTSGRWRVPFVMGGFNAPLVRRSHALTEGGYGPEFRYRELQDVGGGLVGALRGAGMVAGIAAVGAGLALAATRAVLDRVLPAPGEGPSAEQRARGGFTMEIVADTETGARYRTVVSADLDPGYDGTAVMLGQSGLALAGGEGHGAGVLTPATALGQDLVDRLRAHGFTFATERLR
ncbi:saccharopine dehydrogenase family protein [Ornithinimicrobium cryptoxanthini]|uniref:Saccharopine dehydrogenase NADP-binding domain-containing protein n=1 Tax=Ornithinimicrobium cryptoxanthini TaxID=2934161 RepID=A0ABY4YM35_9MICO|nr:saccharopine dehydrogenase NADP-binding domain-containing protein [Ornithinimicrobium cryptoxanthini]USQ77744.1 saccharopine dehydrogenase NADP-binding domain-containing protein [Ornithinimicrobium cryptoxanthini]